MKRSPSTQVITHTHTHLILHQMKSQYISHIKVEETSFFNLFFLSGEVMSFVLSDTMETFDWGSTVGPKVLVTLPEPFLESDLLLCHHFSSLKSVVRRRKVTMLWRWIPHSLDNILPCLVDSNFCYTLFF